MTTAPASIAEIPGNPGGIRTQATKYTGMAGAISEAISMLKAIVNDSACQESEAIEALAANVGNAGDRLNDLKLRYETAGSELTSYATVLEAQQVEAAAAVSMRDSAQNSQTYYQREYDQAHHDARTHVDLAYREQAAGRAVVMSAQLQQTGNSLAAAGNKHAAAVEAVRLAGNQAADAIAKVIGSDGVGDSLWDKISGAMKDWVTANAGWLKILKEVLGALTAIVGILSIFFPILAPLALILAGATLVVSLGLALAGKGSWLDVGLDVIGVLTFGVGAVAVRGAGLALKGMQAMRGLSYNRQTTTLFQRIVHPISTRSSAIAKVGDEFQSLMPAGQTLMTRMPNTTLAEKFSKEWLTLSGRQVEQFKIITQQAQLGSGSIRSSFIEGIGEGLVAVQAGTQRIGSTLDAFGVGSGALNVYDMFGAPGDIPVISDLNSAWQSVQTSTSSAVGTNWATGGVR